MLAMSVGLEKCPKTCKLCSELAQLNNVDRDCIEDQATDTPSVDDPVYKQSCASLKAAGMCSKIGDAQDEVRRHLRFLPRAGGRCERQGPMRQAQLVPVEGRPLHPVPVLAHETKPDCSSNAKCTWQQVKIQSGGKLKRCRSATTRRATEGAQEVE